MPRLTARPLTQKLIDLTPSPTSGVAVLRDATERGLTLRVWPSGTRSWSLEYRSPVSGKNCRLGLPEGTLTAARTIARAHRGTIALGRDPAHEAKVELEERRETHAKSVTVSGALDIYEANVLASAAKLTSRRNRVRALRRALEGFEERAVTSITRGDLIKRLDQIQVAAGDVSRNRGQSELRHFLGWCRDRDIVPAIVLDRVRRGVRETPRSRVLNDDEIVRIINATSDGSAWSDLVRTLLFTATRRNEAASLQVGDLDFSAMTIVIREEVSKTRIARTIPLPSAIAPMLRGRAMGLARDAFLFGEGSGFVNPYSGFSKSFAKLWSVMPKNSERFTLHDIRRTVATRMHESGTDALVIEDILGHLSGIRGGVAGIYNSAKTLDRQRHALESWGETLQKRVVIGATKS
jgi:integrase